MSILIKGFGMPRACQVCPLGHWNKLDELTGCEMVKRYVPKDDVEFWENDRPSWCPLVEVPTPHGRLIAADKLERDIEQYHLSDGKFQHWVQVQNTIIEAEEGEPDVSVD